MEILKGTKYFDMKTSEDQRKNIVRSILNKLGVGQSAETFINSETIIDIKEAEKKFWATNDQIFDQFVTYIYHNLLNDESQKEVDFDKVKGELQSYKKDTEAMVRAEQGILGYNEMTVEQ